ncbi:MAG: enoyl-CoA hydratase/isomerase family protein [Planctomycetota bacterium]
MNQQFEHILFEQIGPVGKITLNRPEMRNAITTAMAQEVNVALMAAKQDESVRVLVLTGAGDSFCSGLDLQEYYRTTAFKLRAFTDALYHDMTDILYRLNKPIIAAMNGPTIGAGNSFAFACDMIIASDTARIIYSEINRALVPALHTIILPRLIGRYKAMEFLMTGDAVDIREAERLGMVNKVVAREKLEAEVMELANRLAEKSAIAMRLTREAVYRGLDVEYRKAIADAGDLCALVATSEDTKEGMKAFSEKRDPVWKGR